MVEKKCMMEFSSTTCIIYGVYTSDGVIEVLFGVRSNTGSVVLWVYNSWRNFSHW